VECIFYGLDVLPVTQSADIFALFMQPIIILACINCKISIPAVSIISQQDMIW